MSFTATTTKESHMAAVVCDIKDHITLVTLKDIR